MAILITSIVHNQTPEGYDGVLAAVRPYLENAIGFIMHGAYASDDKWHVFEIWETKTAADQWFAKYVAPNIPQGVVPKRTYHTLHSFLENEALRSN